MDSVKNWKKILLQWVKQCNFLETNFYSIDQTEIELFFIHFKDRFKGDIREYNNLSVFLKEQYPLFETHFDDENTLSAGDHIYVYSLLLHFSCVRYPEPFFHDICKKLDEHSQRNIEAFLQKLLNDESLTKENLRHVIASINVFTPPSSRFLMEIDSPLKTPMKNTDISPPTPRSCLLQEKNQRVHSLTAQLETLNYEKSVLELDLKRYQDEIDKLNQEQKKAQQEIQDLRNELLSKSSENIDSGKRQTGEEQIRRLNKKIAQKEQEIAKQLETIEDLTSHKEHLSEKLKNAEKEIKNLRNSAKELAERVDYLSAEIDQKDSEIQNLSDVKCELEQHIREIRSSTANRPDLNMSADEFLDFSRVTNSSGSIHSPENLGSVVDIKLREKESENAQLLEEISSMRSENVKLAQAMSDLTSRFSKLLDNPNEGLIIENEENFKDPSNYFIFFLNSIEVLAQKYEENFIALNKLKVDSKQIGEQNLLQAKKLEEMNHKNGQYEQEVQKLQNTITELESKLENSFKERSEEENNMKNLKKEYENLKADKYESEQKLQKQLANLNSCLESKEVSLTHLQLENENQLQFINENKDKFQELHQEILDLKSAEKQKTTYWSRELEKLKQNVDVLSNDKIHNKQEISMLQLKIQTLTDELNLKNSTILQMESDMESLLESMQNERKELSSKIRNYQEKSQSDANQLSELAQKLSNTETELEQIQTDFSHKLDETNQVFSKFNVYLLNTLSDLKPKFDFKTNKMSSKPPLEISDFESFDGKLKDETISLIGGMTSLKSACEQIVEENASLRPKAAEQEKTAEENMSLKNTNTHLEAEILSKGSIIDDLTKSETYLRNQLTSMLSSIKELESDLTHKTNSIEQLDKFVKELQQNVTILESNSDMAIKRANDLENEMENLNEKLMDEKADKNALKNELKNKQEYANELQLNVSFLEKQLAETKQESNKISYDINQKLQKTKTELQTEMNEKQQIEKDFKELKLQFDELSTEKTKLTQDLDRIKLQVESESDKKQQELQTSQEEIRNLTTQLNKEVTNTENLKYDLENIKLQLNQEIENKHQLESYLEEFRIQLQQETLKISDITKELDTTKLQLENEISEKTQIAIQLEKEIANSNNLFDNLEKTKQQLNEQIESKCQLESQLEKVRLELQEEVLKNSKLKEDFESTKLQLENEITEKKQSNLDLEKKHSEIQELKKELENKRIKVQQTKKELEELRVKKLDLDNKLKENNKFQSAIEIEMLDKLKRETKEVEKLHSTIVGLRAKNEKLSQQGDEYKRLLVEFEEKLKNETKDKTRITKAYETIKKEKNELMDEKKFLQNKYQYLINDDEKHKIEIKRLHEQIDTLKSKHELQIQQYSTEADKHEKSIANLTQEISSIQKEKDSVEEEMKILSKRLELYHNEQKENESRHSLIEEKSKTDQKEILHNLSLLKTEQLKNQELENQLKKLQLENAKNIETSNNYMKRIEKQALSLGEYQAKCQKLKKDLEASQNALELLKSSGDSSQRETNRINQENKSLKEKVLKYEKSKEQLENRIQTYQKEIEKLIEENKVLQTTENNLKTSYSTLEKGKYNLEDKIRKLVKSLSDSNAALTKLEQDNVQLNLEVGGLNKQLQDYQQQINMKSTEIEKLTLNLIDTKNTNSQFMELNEKHENQAKELVEENSQLKDQLSKLTLRLEITQEHLESTKIDLQDLRTYIEAAKEERDAIERDHRNALKRLAGTEELAEDKRLSEMKFADKIKSLETQISKLSSDNFNLEKLNSKESQINEQLKHEIADLQAKLRESKEAYEEQRLAEGESLKKIKTLESQISKFTDEMYNLDQLRIKDKQIIEQLNKDIAIFQGKLQKSRAICEENDKRWAEEKEHLTAENQERLKETRFELEGKLEKMKNKMKTLYNDEVAKMKKKQEREIAVFKAELDAMKIKNEKHEAHIKKLSNQIFRLNENILEYQKENTFLKTKLNDLENKPRQLMRVKSASSAPTSAHQVLSSNLHMEDEEGEVFNNTYLSDLKDGRMSEYFNTDICAQELQYRNSLLPPHLKSTYLAQFDHQMGEDEIRDTPTLDDSSSTLLNTGQRKKVSGATSYKRPGPPTPSKNAGRLSFGGIGELNREILKESADFATCSSSSAKTPAKFKFFTSKLSMRGDERKSYVTNFKKKLLSGGSIQCSSTPRKSKAHVDQRRLLDQIMSNASPAGSEFSPDCIVKPAVNLPSSLKKLESNRRVSLYKWRQPKVTYASDSGNSDMNSPRYVSSGSKKRSKRLKDRRGSIYLRGTMFARNCRTPTVGGFREVFKNKSKIQRNAHFNKYRHEALNEMLIKKSSLCPENWDETYNNNNDDDFFPKDLEMKNHIAEDGKNDCDENDDKTSRHFQQLLAAKESQAPFEISDINSNPSYYNVNNSSSNVHSRTIYGASVILNRKIPNVSTTMVRKSSIYVKGRDGKSVILVTNQTITLKDLAHMWLQMNISAKSFIALSVTATLIGIISCIIQLIQR